MTTMTLYAREQKRHKYKEQTFGLCGRRRGGVDLREQHWNMYITMCEIDHQSKLDAWNRALRASAMEQPGGMGWEGGGRAVQDRRHLYTYGWFMSVMPKPPQYCKVISLQLKLIN